MTARLLQGDEAFDLGIVAGDQERTMIAQRPDALLGVLDLGGDMEDGRCDLRDLEVLSAGVYTRWYR